MEPRRRRVVFRGKVQGVGFRYTAQSVARGFAVSGFVRNLKNGDVELIAEGGVDTLDGFLGRLGAKMAGYIAETTIDETAATGEFREFEIRY